MKLRQIGPNQTEVDFNGTLTVLFSYETPVAAFKPGTGILRTAKKWSQTTSRHINAWVECFFPESTVTEVSQETLDGMV